MCVFAVFYVYCLNFKEMIPGVGVNMFKITLKVHHDRIRTCDFILIPVIFLICSHQVPGPLSKTLQWKSPLPRIQKPSNHLMS